MCIRDSIQCEAGGEGEQGMAAVATVVMNRATATEGEFSRVGNGGDVRAVITQPGQFVCMRESVAGSYNPQNVYNMTPLAIRKLNWHIGTSMNELLIFSV